MKKYRIVRVVGLLLLSLVMNTTAVYAQVETWEHTFGGSQGDHANVVQITSDGGYLVAGKSSVLGDWDEVYALQQGGTMSTGTYGCIWIGKINAHGDLLWEHLIRGDEYANAHVIQPTPDGGYIVGGLIESPIQERNGGWVIKLDAQRRTVWERILPGSNDQEGISDIFLTPDHGYLVAGFLYINKTFGSGMLKLDTEGNVEWELTFHGGSSYEGMELQLTPDGGYIVANTIKSDIRVLKLNAQQQPEWESRFGGCEKERVWAVQLTPDGGYIVAGSTESKGAGSADAWVLKLTSQGQLEWDKTFGGQGYDWAEAVQRTQDGGYILAGGNAANAWVLKLDAQGQQVWERTFGDNGSDGASDIQITSDGGYIVAGYKDVGYGRKQDIWVLKLNADGMLLEH